MPTLVIRGPDGTLSEHELVGRLTVGADEGNDLIWRSGGVEKRHAGFFADGGEVVLEQLDASAEKTIVDGEPMRGRRRLKPGVRVVIGDYEVHVKPDQLTVRKVDAEPPPPAGAVQLPWRLIGVALALAVAGILVAGLLVRRAAPEPAPPAVAFDPCANLEPTLMRARAGATPQALAAVNEVLACDPINDEALRLERSIPQEMKGRELSLRARELLELSRDEQALEVLEQIPPGTLAAREAAPVVQEVAGRLSKRAKADCDEYRKAKKPQADARCAEHARLVALVPAEKPAPSAVPRDPVLAAYEDGRIADAVTLLQKVRERADQAPRHAWAEALRKDISNADALQKVGSRALEKGELPRAAAAFSDALALDAKVLPDGRSALRKGIELEVSAAALRIGRGHAQHQDFKRACAAWKVGFGFYRGNTDLLDALANECSQRARELLESVRCEDLALALTLAVPGDSLGEAIARRRAELRCR